MLYLVPEETINGIFRGPKYFRWRHPSGVSGTGTIIARWTPMEYGFMPTVLIHALDVSPADMTFLAAQPDVYVWPDNLDQPVTDPTIDAFFEGLQIPTDWLTPSTTYRELLRNMAGLFQYNQRYNGISQGHSIFEGGVTLETNYNQMSPQQITWFDATSESLGYPPVQGNPKLRALAKQAGDLWGSKPFILGSYTF